jgi:hypothetical protein
VRPFRSTTGIRLARLAFHRQMEKDREQEKQQRWTSHNNLHGR